jgi:hypothetical protein
MKTTRILATILSVVALALGLLLSQPLGRDTAHVLIISGTIIIAGLLIASAINETKK